jgi:uracil-DNA glycosylase family 4
MNGQPPEYPADRERFEPCLWAEDPAPVCARDCASCELSRQRTRVVWGEGNPKAEIMVLLDNPGLREDREGQAFVCGTRSTLQQAAHAVGLTEEDLYVTYVLKCRPLRRYDKAPARGACMRHLADQLASGGFKTVFCLGDTAVKAFFGDPDLSVKTTRGRRHDIRGFSVYTSYHPLAVRRRPNLYALFLSDWGRVAEESKSSYGFYH